MRNIIPTSQRLWKFKCPCCENGQIIGLRLKDSEYERFHYKGKCCAYYPHENHLIDEMIRTVKGKNK
jgi:hypothetical protein